MKTTIQKVSLLLLLLVTFSNLIYSQNEIEPVTYTILSENDDFIVYMGTWQPGAIETWHPHSAHSAYALTDVEMKIEEEGKEPYIIKIKKGEAIVSPSVIHQSSNPTKIAFSLLYTEEKEKEDVKIEAPVYATHVLVVNYELIDISLKDFSKMGPAIVSNWAPGKIDGLIGKTWVGNVDRPVFGGVYYFTNKEAVDKYLASEFWKGVKSNPNLVNFKEDVYEIAPFSNVSNGIPRMPLTNR